MNPDPTVTATLTETLRERAAADGQPPVTAADIRQRARRRQRGRVGVGVAAAVAAGAVGVTAVGAIGWGTTAPLPSQSVSTSTTLAGSAADESFLWVRTLPEGPPAAPSAASLGSPTARRTATGLVQVRTGAGWTSLPDAVQQLESPLAVRGGWVFRAGPRAVTGADHVMTSIVFVSDTGTVRVLDSAAWVGEVIVDPTGTRLAWTGGTVVSPRRADLLRVVRIADGVGASFVAQVGHRGHLATWGPDGITFVRLEGQRGVEPDGSTSPGPDDTAPIQVFDVDGPGQGWRVTESALSIVGLDRAVDYRGPSGRAVLDVRAAGGLVCARVMDGSVVRETSLGCATNLWHELAAGAHEMVIGQAEGTIADGARPGGVGDSGQPVETAVVMLEDGTHQYLPGPLRRLPATDLRWESPGVLVGAVSRTRGQESAGFRWRLAARTGQHIPLSSTLSAGSASTTPVLP